MAETPKQIGKYVIDSLLGRGGMGEVYKAYDPTLGRYVALKIMCGPALDDTSARERFIREAQAAGGLRHPNIVTVYDLGEVNNQMYIAMEFIRGEDLEKIIKSRAPLSIEQKLNIMIQACEGVAYAHRHQIVHRDLKPSNIRVDEEGIVKIMDFGIARVESSNMTASGAVLGTPYYMSPEQVRGMRVDNRSDIFSLGCILYEFLTYQKAFFGDMVHVFYKIAHEQPVPIAEFMNIPAASLQNIIDRCLEKDKSKRLQSASELADLLRQAQVEYRDMNAATVIGLKAPAAPESSTEFRLSQPPTAVGERSRTSQTAGVPAPPTVLPSTHMESDSISAIRMAAPPPVPSTYPSPSAPTSGSSVARIVLLLTVLLAGFIGAGTGTYYVFFKKADRENKDNTKTPVDISEVKSLYQLEKYEEAIRAGEALLKQSPEDAELHFLVGAAKEKIQKTPEAYLEYQKAVQLNPKMEKAWYKIGVILSQRMDYNNAEDAFQKALEINPQFAASWEGLAQTYFLKQDHEKAEHAYLKLLELEPDNVTALYNLGLIQLGKKDYTSAKASFKKALSVNPNWAEAHNNLGLVYLKEGLIEQSILENEAALQLKPNLPSAHYNLYIAYDQKKEWQNAALHLQRYMELSGDEDPELKKKLEEYGS